MRQTRKDWAPQSIIIYHNHNVNAHRSGHKSHSTFHLIYWENIYNCSNITQMFHVSDDNNFLFLQQIWSLQTALIILEFSPLGLWCRWCPGWERRERLLGVISLQCAPLVWCWHWCEIRTCHGASSSQQLRTVETDNCYDDDQWESVMRSQHLHGFLYNLTTGLSWV